MEKSDVCICQEDEWFNAFGETTTLLKRGMRLTVSGSYRVAGSAFYRFRETPAECAFLAIGFKPMRELN